MTDAERIADMEKRLAALEKTRKRVEYADERILRAARAYALAVSGYDTNSNGDLLRFGGLGDQEVVVDHLGRCLLSAARELIIANAAEGLIV